MAITTSRLIAAPMLQDSFVAKDGTPLSAGVITCYVDTSRTTLKNWYYQVGAPGDYIFITLPNPMTLSAAGTIEDVNGNDTIPFFYPYNEVDNSTEPYYITVDDSGGERQFTRENFPFFEEPTPNIVSVQTLEQYIVNNCFWRNVGSLDLTFSNTTPSVSVNGLPVYYATVAPSQHDGFHLPDITFVKNTFGSVDTVTFNTFPLGETPLFPNDITPEFYINHACTGIGGGEALKAYQFPISLHVQTLDSVNVTFTVEAMNNGTASPSNILIIALYKYLGTGATSPDPIVVEQFTLTSVWDQYSVNFTFPTTEDDILSSVGDDAYYMQIGLAPSQLINVNFTLPSIYLGTDVPTNSFKTYDQIDSIINSPRTGDIRTSLNSFSPFGWVPMNNGTIGNNLSSAGGAVKATARNNKDTWQLYNLIWTLFSPYNLLTVNPLAQMYDSLGMPVAYGTAAYGDFIANKCISLTQTMGKVILGTVPVSNILAPYKATFTAASGAAGLSSVTTSTVKTVTGVLKIQTGSTVNYYNGLPVQFATSGALPGNISANTTYYIANFNGTNNFNLSTTQSGAYGATQNLIAFSSTGNNSSVSTGILLTAANNVSFFNGMPVYVSNTGGALPDALLPNTIYYVCNFNGTTGFNLATSFANAVAGLAIQYATTNGTGTQTIVAAFSGTFEGEYSHAQLITEMAQHVHTPLTQANFVSAVSAGGDGNYGTNTTMVKVDTTTAPSGSSAPSNVTQPGTFLNLFMKL